MKIRFTLFSIFFCFQAILFSQTNGLGTPGNGLCPTCPAPNPTTPATPKKGGNAQVLNGNEAINTSYTATACGLNYISANFNLNQRSFGNGVGTGAIQPAPFVVSGWPLCGKIFKAFLYTSCEGGATPPTINASITNPQSANSIFPMTLIGTGASKCWSYDQSYAYRADITSIISGNGTYYLSGLPVDPSPNDVNGASLFIIYTDESQNYTGSIVIADGMLSSTGNSLTAAISGFSVCSAPLQTTNFMILDDLQAAGNANLTLNGGAYAIPMAGQVPWMLISQPGGAVVAGQTNANYTMSDPSDCVGMIMTGLYYRTMCLTCPDPLTFSLTAASPPCSPTGSANIVSTGGFPPLTYTWSGSAATTSAVTGLAPGTHTVYAKDNNSCRSGSTTVTVTRPSTITVPNSTLCVGYSTTLTAGPTTSYTWSPGASLNTVNGPSVIANPLVTTIYTVLSTNSLNCVSTNTMQLLVSPTQTITIANPTTCVRGDLVLEASSTYTGATYSWSGPGGYFYPPSITPNPTLNPASLAMNGNYTLTVISVPGCTTTAVASATVFPLPTPTIITNAPICTGETLSMLGTGAVNYTWSAGGAFSTLPNALIPNAVDVVHSGTYTLTAAFANGCADTVSKYLLVKPLPVPVVGYNSPLCAGKTLSLTASAAASTTFTWTGPNAFSSTLANPTIANVTALQAGTYSVLASLVSCTATTNTLVVVNPLPTPIANNNSPACATKSVLLTGSGAATYTWTGPLSYNSAVQNATVDPTVMGSAGVYTLTVTDAIGCQNTAVTTVTILPNPVIVATGTNVCIDGPGTLTVTGGSGYTWTGPNAFISNVATPTVPIVNAASSGIYTVTVAGANSCTSTATASLGTVPLPVVFPTPTIACFGSTATLTATGAVSYTWTGPNGYAAFSPTAVIPTANNASIGTYTIVGRGANSCIDTFYTTLDTMALPIISATGTIVCLKQPALLTTNASFTSDYLWLGPAGFTSTNSIATIPSATNVPVRTYTVIATAPNSCTSSATATLGTYPLPTVTAVSSVICEYYSYTVTANGANNYSWTAPNGNITPNTSTLVVPSVAASNLSTGQYTIVGSVVMSPAATCTNTGYVTLTTMPLPTISAVGSTVCIGKSTTLLSSGGVGGGYTWTAPNSSTSSAQNLFIPVVDYTSAGIYTVVGIAPNTCTNFATPTLSFHLLPQPTYIAPQRVCFKSFVTLQGFGAKTYTWTGPYNYFSANKDVTFPMYNMQQAGTYTLSVLDSVGCFNDTTALIKIDPLPDGKLVSDNVNKYCVPYCSKFALQNTGITALTNVSWLINNKVFLGDTFSYCVTKPGNNLAIGTLSNDLGCVNTVTFTMEAYPKPEADFVYTPDAPAESLDDVIFKNASIGDKQVTWDWYFISNKGFIGSGENTSYLFSDAGSYQVAMVVTNTWGCADTVIKNIVIESDVKLYVPNAFTPNGDGLNDVFQPKGRGISKYTLSIFDRWSNIIFQTNDFAKGWDGRQGGTNCTDDVYIWRINAIDSNGKVKELTGFVALLR